VQLQTYHHRNYQSHVIGIQVLLANAFASWRRRTVWEMTETGSDVASRRRIAVTQCRASMTPPTTWRQLPVLHYDTSDWAAAAEATSTDTPSANSISPADTEQTGRDRDVLQYVRIRCMDHNSIVLTRRVDIDHSSHTYGVQTPPATILPPRHFPPCRRSFVAVGLLNAPFAQSPA